jgi:heptosyltransferase-2
MHVAAALDKPLVVIYGSTDPRFTPPLTRRAQILSLGLPCSPCFKRECPLEHMNCLNDLSVDRVLSALDQLVAA